MAEDVNTNSTSDEMNVDTLDDVASLLAGEVDTDEEVETEEQTNADDDSVDDENLPDESTEDAEESELEEQEAEAEEDADVTWAGVLGVSDDQVVLDENGDFKAVKVKVDGVESEVPMKDLVAGYQTNQHNSNIGKSLSEQRKEFETNRDAAVQEYTTRLEDTVKLTEYLNQKLVGEFQNVNWDELRQNNPGEYAAMMQDFNQRNQEIQQIYGAINQEREFAKSEAEKASQAKDSEFLKSNVERMIENNPEWKDHAVMKTAFDGFSNFVQDTYGFTQEEFNTVKDSRLIELVKDAQKYREGLKTVANKKVKHVPKFQKPGAKKAGGKTSKLDSLVKKAKTTTGASKKGAQTNAIAELLVNSQ